MSVTEGRLLWQLAAGKSVLELGTAAGRATVCLAQQAKRVATVDAKDQSEAREWTRRCDVSERAVFHQGEMQAVCRGLDERFEMVFVNNATDEASLRRAIEALSPRLVPGGQVAFHNYPDPSWPVVRRIVDEHAARHNWQRVAQADYMGVFGEER